MHTHPQTRMDYRLDMEDETLEEKLEKLVQMCGKRPLNCMTKANDDNPYFSR